MVRSANVHPLTTASHPRTRVAAALLAHSPLGTILPPPVMSVCLSRPQALAPCPPPCRRPPRRPALHPQAASVSASVPDTRRARPALHMAQRLRHWLPGPARRRGRLRHRSENACSPRFGPPRAPKGGRIPLAPLLSSPSYKPTPASPWPPDHARTHPIRASQGPWRPARDPCSVCRPPSAAASDRAVPYHPPCPPPVRPSVHPRAVRPSSGPSTRDSAWASARESPVLLPRRGPDRKSLCRPCSHSASQPDKNEGVLGRERANNRRHCPPPRRPYASVNRVAAELKPRQRGKRVGVRSRSNGGFDTHGWLPAVITGAAPSSRPANEAAPRPLRSFVGAAACAPSLWRRSADAHRTAVASGPTLHHRFCRHFAPLLATPAQHTTASYSVRSRRAHLGRRAASHILIAARLFSSSAQKYGVARNAVVCTVRRQPARAKADWPGHRRRLASTLIRSYCGVRELDGR